MRTVTLGLFTVTFVLLSPTLTCCHFTTALTYIAVPYPTTKGTIEGPTVVLLLPASVYARASCLEHRQLRF